MLKLVPQFIYVIAFSILQLVGPQFIYIIVFSILQLVPQFIYIIVFSILQLVPQFIYIIVFSILQLVGPQFSFAIAPVIGESWTPETEQAWSDLFKVVSYHMKQAMVM